MKRAKLAEEDNGLLSDAMEQMTTLTTCPEDHVPWGHQSKFSSDDQAIISKNSLMHNIGDDIFFTEKFPIRMHLKQLNVISLEEIDVVLVSNFQEIYALPFLVRAGERFKAKIYITTAMA